MCPRRFLKPAAKLLLLFLLRAAVPGAMDRMELRKVATEPDDDSTDSLDERFTEPIDSEKATINRSVTRI